MAAVPQLKRLQIEDFSGQSEWIANLLDPLNLYFAQTNAILNKGVTLEENCAATLITVELSGTLPVKVLWPLSSRPQSVLVGNVARSDGTSFTLSAAVQVQWSFNQAGQLQINNVVGITPTATTKYKLLLECKAG